MATTIGMVDIETIAKQLVHVANIKGLKPADLTTFDDGDWGALVKDAFGYDNADVRLLVILDLAAQHPVTYRQAA